MKWSILIGSLYCRRIFVVGPYLLVLPRIVPHKPVTLVLAGYEPLVIHAADGFQQCCLFDVVGGRDRGHPVIYGLLALQLLDERFSRQACQLAIRVGYMVGFRHTVAEATDGLHHLGLRVDHRMGCMEYVRQHDDVRLVVQLDVHGRVEATGEEIDLG